MDKLEVLMRLDLLDLELSREEDVLREHSNKWDGNTLLGSYYFGKMSGVKWAREALEKVRSAIVYADEPSEVTELCPHCENEVVLHWDVKDRGYKAFCPLCGERLMLCSACHDDDFACDYSKDTDGCRWNLAEGRKQ